MTINQLECLCVLGKTMNFIAAAKELYISQPALSKQIAHMEEELGFKLFNRSNRVITFTEKGKLFYDSACKMMEEYHRILNLCQGNNEFKVGYFKGVKDFIYEKYIAPMVQKYPDYQITAKELTGKNALEELKKGEIDILFSSIYFIKDDSTIGFHPLSSIRYVGIMHKNHPLAYREVLYPNDFNGIQVIPAVQRNRNKSTEMIESDILKSSPEVCFVNNNETLDEISISLLSGKTVAILSEARTITSNLLTAIPFEAKYGYEFGFYYLKSNHKVQKMIE